MRKFLFATLLLALVSPAAAADFPVKGPIFVPQFDWTGFYIGINGGYGWGTTTGDIAPTFFGGNYGINGGLIGGTVGGNYQMGRWVVGVEADWDWANISGTGSVAGIPIVNSKIDSLGTARGRVGAAWDRVLVYGTGGFAWADNSATIFLGTDSHTHLGWTLGAGLEYALTRSITVKAEYLYVRLNDTNYFGNVAPPCPGPCSLGAQVSLVRAGVNWLFH